MPQGTSGIRPAIPPRINTDAAGKNNHHQFSGNGEKLKVKNEKVKVKKGRDSSLSSLFFFTFSFFASIPACQSSINTTARMMISLGGLSQLGRSSYVSPALTLQVPPSLLS